MKPLRILLIIVMLGIPALGLALFQFPGSDSYESYAAGVPTDAIAHLQQKIDSGELKLNFDPDWGYLPSVLKALHIPASSQSLVYSKTSFQLDKIAPWSPRAIYFNDDVYVGWVSHGTVVEVASVDSNLGAVFYTLDQKETEKPKFERQISNCLQCHESKLNTGGVPGFVVQSVYTDRYGYPLPSMNNPVSSDRTPLSNRFGGWYVTGTHGSQVHMGNIVPAKEAREIGNVEVYLKRLNLSDTGNVTDLSKLFNTKPYLSKGSDIAALMLLIHQTYVHNLMTLANEDSHEGPNSKPEALVRGLLFYREARLDGPIEGSADFAKEFSQEGPRDRKGRSLRDLDLNQRLLKYPLSYLIYSKGFDGLQWNVKQYVARRLREILTGKDNSPEFAYLTPEDRQAILEILQDTKPGFLDLETDRRQ
jgi:hypothetical protein